MATGKIVGVPTPRVEGVGKVTGEAVYAVDVTLPDMLWGRVLRSPIPYGRIRRIDTSRAEQAPGVRAVVTGEDVAGLKIGRRLCDMPILAEDVVRFVGEKVAAVAADTEEAAERALELIEVEYEDMEPLLDPLEAVKPSAPLLHPDVVNYDGLMAPLEEPTNTFVYLSWGKGDIEKGFAESDVIVENTFYTQPQHQGYIEPHSCVVDVKEAGNAEIWACSKTPFALRQQIAKALEVPFESLMVHPCYIGGDFGGKGDFMDVAVAYVLSRKSGRPVKMVMDYDEELMAGNPRHACTIKVRTGVKRDGRIMAHHLDFIFDSGAYGAFKPIGFLFGAQEAGGPYNMPHHLSEERVVYTNKIPCGHMRAPGDPQGFFATESQMDAVAGALGMDPVEFRRINLMHDGDESPTGHVMHHIKAEETLDLALKESGYRAPKGPTTGRGVAVAQWLPLGGECYAFVTIGTDGAVTVSCAAMDQGSGTYTVLRQLVAQELQVPLESVNLVTLDSTQVEKDQGLGGSRGTRIYGNAAWFAVTAVKEELLRVAAEAMATDASRLALAEGGVTQLDAERRMTYAEIARAKGAEIRGEGYYNDTTMGPEASMCAQVVEVDVDPETGQVRLDKVTVAINTGTVINPLLHQGQIDGGIVMAAGYALMEEVQFDDGKVTTANLGDYKIPTIRDVPELRTALIRSDTGSGPYNSMSIGETPVIPFAAAVANAVADATGARIHSLPVTAEKVQSRMSGSAAPAAGAAGQGLDSVLPRG